MSRSGGFFQKIFGGRVPEPTTPSDLSAASNEPDYASIDRMRRTVGNREMSMPLSPRVTFGGAQEVPPADVHRGVGQSPYRPRAESAHSMRGGRAPPGGLTRAQHNTSRASDLDDLTADLLRLSTEPERRGSSSSSGFGGRRDIPRSTSTSAVPQRRMEDGHPPSGVLRGANVFTWDTGKESPRPTREAQPVLYVQQGPLARTTSAGPYSRSPMQPSPQSIGDPTSHYAQIPSQRSTPQQMDSQSQPRDFPQNKEGKMPNGLPPGLPMDDDSISRGETPSQGGTTREKIVEVEERTKAPPVVRTTVEGKLKMEKIVGADLITVDSCVSSAWTVRDTTTNYKIKTTIGKRTLILEELKKSTTETGEGGGEGRYKITLIEDGETKAEKEAKLDIPPGVMDKKAYLSEVSRNLIQQDIPGYGPPSGVGQDGVPGGPGVPGSGLPGAPGGPPLDDAVSALTHVEIEVVEDVTNILKTYVIGERADEHLPIDIGEPVDAQLKVEAPPKHVEENHAPSPSLDDAESLRMERIYVDLLQPEDEERELERAEYHLRAQGAHLEGESTLRRLHRLESSSSFDSYQTRCAHVFADCDLVKMEDSSLFIVTIAQPRVAEIICEMRRARKTKKMEKAKISAEQEGMRYEGETTLQRTRRLETSDSFEEPKQERMEEIIMEEVRETKETRIEESEVKETKVEEMKLEEIKQEEVKVVQVVEELKETYREEKVKEERIREAEGAEYQMRTEGMDLRGEVRIGGKRQHLESESSEELQREREAEGGQYELRELGMQLSGETRLKRQGRYDSVSSADSSIYGGGPTIVDLVREESHSHYQAIIEISNWAEPLLMKLRERKIEAAQAIVTFREQKLKDERTEHVKMTERKQETQVRVQESSEEQATLMAGIQNAASYQEMHQQTLKEVHTAKTEGKVQEYGDEHSVNVVVLEQRGLNDELSEKTLLDARKAQDALKTQEFREEGTTLVASLQSASDTSYQTSKEVHTSRSESHAHSTKASSQVSASSMNSLNRSQESFSVVGRAKERASSSASSRFVEYSNLQETCAIMMKRSGGLYERSERTMSEIVTGTVCVVRIVNRIGLR